MKSIDEIWQPIYGAAGMLAAHAVWQLYDDDVVVPVLAYVNDGEKVAEQLVANSMEELQSAISKAGDALVQNPMKADFAILIYPAAVDLQKKGQTCIVIDMCSYETTEPTSSRLVVPFTSPNKLFRTKLSIHPLGQMDYSADFDVDQAIQAFFEGVNSHDEGAAIWNSCMKG